MGSISARRERDKSAARDATEGWRQQGFDFVVAYITNGIHDKSKSKSKSRAE